MGGYTDLFNYLFGEQRMNPKTQYKLVGFLVVLGVFFLISGSDLHSRFVRRLMLAYGTGAVIAFWVGREPIGTFRPITMAPICIALGSLMMIFALILLVSVKQAKHSSGLQPNLKGCIAAKRAF